MSGAAIRIWPARDVGPVTSGCSGDNAACNTAAGSKAAAAAKIQRSPLRDPISNARTIDLPRWSALAVVYTLAPG